MGQITVDAWSASNENAGVASNAGDGDTGTFWGPSTDPSPTEPYITADFGEDRLLLSFKAHSKADGANGVRLRGMTLQYSDNGTGFTEQEAGFEHTNVDGEETFNIASPSAHRYWRVIVVSRWCTDASYIHIHELKFYESDTTTTTTSSTTTSSTTTSSTTTSSTTTSSTTTSSTTTTTVVGSIINLQSVVTQKIKLMYRNILESSTVTVTSENASFPKYRLYDRDIGKLFKGNSTPSNFYITLDQGSGELYAVDRLIIPAGHNLDGLALKLEYSNDNFVSNIQVANQWVQSGNGLINIHVLDGMGSEIMINGGMETGNPPTGWVGYLNPEVFERSNVQKYSGSYSAHLIDSVPSNGGFYRYDLAKTASKTYRLVYRYYIVSGTLQALILDGGAASNYGDLVHSAAGLWLYGAIVGINPTSGSMGGAYFRNYSNVVPAEFYIDVVSLIEYENRVVNGAFASDTSPWSPSNCTIASVAGGLIGNCCEMTCTAAGQKQIVQGGISLVSGHQYKLKVFAKNGSLTSKLVGASVFKGGYAEMFTPQFTTSASWQSREIIFTAPVSASDYNIYLYYFGADDSGTLLFGEVSLTEMEESPKVSRYWRLNIASPSAAPELSEMFLTKAYEFERNPSWGFGYGIKRNVNREESLSGYIQKTKWGERRLHQKYDLTKISDAQMAEFKAWDDSCEGSKSFYVDDILGTIFFAELVENGLPDFKAEGLGRWGLSFEVLEVLA